MVRFSTNFHFWELFSFSYPQSNALKSSALFTSDFLVLLSSDIYSPNYQTNYDVENVGIDANSGA